MILDNMPKSGASSRNPFNLPELRQVISLFVAAKDAISCALVCKAWTDDFVHAIWHTVDFGKHPGFINLPQDIISKHGHYIRVINSLAHSEDLSWFDHAAISNLNRLMIKTSADPKYKVHVYNIIFRNVHNLRILDVNFNIDYSDVPNLRGYPIFRPNTLQGVTLKLTRLKIGHIAILFTEFVAILRACPVLERLEFAYTHILERTDLSFRHTNLKRLHGSIDDLIPYNGPSLLCYFPNLTLLYVLPFSDLRNFPVFRIKSAIADYCPNLTGFGFEGEESLILKFCTLIIKNLTIIRLNFNVITPELINAILLHRDSLKVFSMYAESNGFWLRIGGMANAPFTYKGRGAILQQIPMACSRLEKLSFHAHEVDMYDIEGGDWICKDLEILQIRVKGLDTKEKIAKAVELWRFGTRERWRRQVKESKTAEMIEADAKEQEEWKEDERKDEVSKVQGSIDTSIEARVARHLLKFEKLQVVYLGDYDLVSLEEKFSV